MSNPDCRASSIEVRVWYLLGSRSDLDTAAKYARLAAFSRFKTEETELTCQYIISTMLQNKRHKDVYDLYDYFFNQHKLKPNYHCCNYMIESLFQQGLVDKALDFHRSIKSGMALGYPSQDTFRILTTGLVNSGRLDEAEALLQAQGLRSSIYPNHVAFNSLIRALLDLGNIDKANQVLLHFQQLWANIDLSRVDLYNYSPEEEIMVEEYENKVAFLTATFMEYWFKQGKEMEAKDCYNQSVLANKFPICAETGNAFLKILLKYGKKTHAWALYHEMLDQNESSTFTVKMMVDECFDMGQCRKAIEAYNMAIAKNRFLSDPYMITRCCENGMLSVAESLAADMGGVGFGFMDNTIFKTMIDAYLKAGRIDDAIKTSNQMIDATLKDLPNLF